MALWEYIQSFIRLLPLALDLGRIGDQAVFELLIFQRKGWS